MSKLTASLGTGIPGALAEIIIPGRTLNKRAADIGLFRPAGTSNGPTEAITRGLEHLSGTALWVRDLTNYIARSLRETRRIQIPATSCIVKSR